MKYAVFNRLRDENANDGEPYVIEFDKQIEFMIDEETGRTYCEEYNIVFDEIITPPQKFYEAVLNTFLGMYAVDKLTGCKIYTRDEWEDHIEVK